jgi:hypothetical protein
MRLLFTFSLLILLISCEKDVIEVEDFDGTWKVDWIRCDNFHNKVFGELSFTVTDSTENKGVIKETVVDSVSTINEINFHFNFISTEELVIDTLFIINEESLIDTLIVGDTTAHWLGTHAISELQENSFILERGSKSCERELYKFVK